MRAAGDLLERALQRRGACRVVAAWERPWASVTFVGTQHRVRLAVEAEAFLDGIEEAEFDLGEYLLADIAVVEREWVEGELVVMLEALALEDWRPPSSSPPAQAGAQSRRRRRLWPWSPACAGVEGTETQTTCGTKRAFVPLAAA